MSLATLIVKCIEPTVDESPRFWLREATPEDRLGVSRLLEYEHEARRMAAVAACALNGRVLDGDDVLRCVVIVECGVEIVGVLVATEGGQAVRVSELYVGYGRRRIGLGDQLLFVARYWGSRSLNPIVVTLSAADVAGAKWLKRRGYQSACHCDGSPVRLGPGLDGFEQLCLVHPNGCGFQSVRIAR